MRLLQMTLEWYAADAHQLKNQLLQKGSRTTQGKSLWELVMEEMMWA